MTQPQEKPLPVELKPCPFCGAKTVYTAPPAMGKGRWVVECDDCRAEGPASSDNSDAGEDEAIAAWNTRARCEEAYRLLRALADETDSMSWHCNQRAGPALSEARAFLGESHDN